ncbi:E2.7.3.3 [Mytilus coruscus]|uniref:E2.7.3.3 n=1 Tax=Mytilus coruscus TaxID=42192 RepID=A0A6J8E7T0_MYTCO|nr:E2.7.3.3 [Mytilus coruscus]
MDNLKFRELDEAGDFIISTRVRIGRCHKGFTYPPILANMQRKEMEDKVAKALNTLEGDLKDAYHSLETIPRNEYQQFVDDHIMLRDNHTLRDAGGYDGWPIRRGVYLNNNRTFTVWALQQIEVKVEFAYDVKRGFLSNCPSNLGTCLRASVHLKMPKLERNKVCMANILSDEAGYDVSNKRRLGLTEYLAVCKMYNSVEELIKTEQQLEGN